jgi:histidine triad (HIT) family protein
MSQPNNGQNQRRQLAATKGEGKRRFVLTEIVNTLAETTKKQAVPGAITKITAHRLKTSPLQNSAQCPSPPIAQKPSVRSPRATSWHLTMSNPPATKTAAKAETPLEDRKCPFCPIIQDEKKAVTKVYHHKSWDDDFLVIQPIDPVTEGHLLIIPRVHVQDARDAEVFGKTCAAASLVAQELYPDQDFNIVNNNGLMAGQTANHLHVHSILRRVNDNLVFPWANQLPNHYNTTGQPRHPPHVLPTFHKDYKPLQ